MFAPPAHTSRHEAAFGLIELLIVMVIVGIMAGLTVVGMKSTRRTGTVEQARAAATTYRDAIEMFRDGHGDRVPLMPSKASPPRYPTDWPAAPPATSGVATNVKPFAWGPLDTGAQGRPYARVAPEVIADGTIRVVDAGVRGFSWTRAAQTDPMSRVVYDTQGLTSYQVVVQERSSTTWVTSCALGPLANAEAQAC